ncbi:choice-of-anchor tandem repeat GloVer-containing protein [Candidatus Auribacterota bacterium]
MKKLLLTLTISFLLMPLLSVSALYAAERTWSGDSGDNANWDNGDNWDTNPSAGDSLTFGDGSSARKTNTNNFGAGTNFGLIKFVETGFTLSGDSLLLDTGGGIENTTGSNTIAIDLTLDDALSFTNSSGTLTFTGTIDNDGNDLTVNSTGTTNLNNDVSGSGALVKSGNGTLNLTGAKTYTGATTISAGTLKPLEDNVIPDSSAVTVESGGELYLIYRTETFGSLAGSGSLLFQGNSDTVTTGGNNSSTEYSGVMGGNAGKFVKTGSGTLTLSGANTNPGTITISEGTIALGANNVLYNTSSVTVESGAVFDLAGYSDTINVLSGTGNVELGSGTLGASSYGGTFTGIISGTGGFTKAWGGTLTLGSANTYTGMTTVADGTLIANSGSLPNTSSISIGGGKMLMLGGDDAINDSATITTTNYSKLNIGSYSDTIAGIVLQDNSPEIIGTTGVLTSTSDYDVRWGSIKANLGGSVGLIKTTSDTVRMYSEMSYTGQTTVSSGYLRYYVNDAIPDSSDVLVNGGTLNLSTYSDTVGTVTLTSGEIAGTGALTGASYDLRSGTVSGVLAGNGNVTKTTTGTVTYSGATSTYTGMTTISAGTLRTSADNVLSDLSAVTVDGGAQLYMLYSDDEIGSLAGAGSVFIQSGGIIAGGDDTSTEFSGVISGSSGYLTKTGSGTLTLSGTNTYTDVTTVSEGTLSVTGSLSGSSAVTVADGAALSGSGTLGPLTLNGTVAPGNSIGTLNVGATTWAPGGSYEWEIDDAEGSAGSAPGWDLLNVTGILDITADSGDPFTIDITSLDGIDISNFDFMDNYSWLVATASGGVTGFDVSDFILDYTDFTNNIGGGVFSIENDTNDINLIFTGGSGEVPEPSTIIMLLALLFLLITWHIRKPRRAAVVIDNKNVKKERQIMKTKELLIALCVLVFLMAPFTAAANTYSVLYDFTYGDPDEGSYPRSELSYSGGYLYGMAYYGGDTATDAGTIFRINTDGSGHTILHDFEVGLNDGGWPTRCGLTHSGGVIYGVTPYGGIGGDTGYGMGTIFRMNENGTGFTLIHKFAENPGRQSAKFEPLLSDGFLYGFTELGGTSDKGTLYRIDTDGGNYTILHNFTGDTGDGRGYRPWEHLILGDSIYGVTYSGGESDKGTVYKIGTDGGNYTVLKEFPNIAVDGYTASSLINVNDKLYGTLWNGPDGYNGNIFSINTDGSEFTHLYLAGGSPDISAPNTLILGPGDNLYGMSKGGGSSGYGAIFSLGTDGDNYSLLHSFTGQPDDGRDPWRGLTFVGNTMYGTTEDGGANDAGTIFSLELDGGGQVPEPSTILLLVPLLGGLWWMRRRRSCHSRACGNLEQQAAIEEQGLDPRLRGDDKSGVMKKLFILVCAVVLFAVPAQAGEISVLHDFSLGSTNGWLPYGSLTLSGDTLYGMAEHGGSNSDGIIFSVDTAGDNFTIVYNFTGGVFSGENPKGSLTLSGGKFYGMTMDGGTSDRGVVFSIDTDGSNYTSLHKFQAGLDDGMTPWGDVTLSGDMLYGMTFAQGISNSGVIFSMDTAGGNYTLIHNFAGGNDDGRYPYGSLKLSDGTLYGMTSQGGDADLGIIFSLAAAGGSFTILHEFTGATGDGSYPRDSLILSGSTFYGMTSEGGDSDAGVIFSIDTAGGNYTLIHNFAGGNDDGQSPYGNLTLSDGMLYGMTRSGGDGNNGVIFSIDTAGSSYTLLHELLGTPDDGRLPYGDLTISGSTLYGMTSAGGATGWGSVLSLELSSGEVPEPSTLLLLLPLLGGLWWMRRRRSCHSRACGNLEQQAAIEDQGRDPRLRGDDKSGVMKKLLLALMIGILAVPLISACAFATTYSVLYDFTSQPEATGPCGDLTYSGGYLYAMTYAGGVSNYGTVFRINTDGTGYTTLHSFTGVDDGAAPYYGKLTHSGSDIYGMTYQGGDSAAGLGTVFKMDNTGSNFTLLHKFTGMPDDGRFGEFDLTLIDDTLYGITNSGGTTNMGTIFSIDTDGNNYTILHNFLGQPDDGYYPKGYLLPLDGLLYGTTYFGGGSNKGIIFSIDTTGGSFTLVYEFDGQPSSSQPMDGLLVINDKFFGTTFYGGESNKGTVFRIDTDGSGYTMLYDFGDGTTGQNLYAHLTLAGGDLYGVAINGGSGGVGSIYRIGTDGNDFTVMHHFEGQPNDASDAYRGLTLVDNTLYGLSYTGGANNTGVMYSLDLGGGGEVPEPNSLGVLALGALGVLYWKRRKKNKEDK